MAKRRLLDIVEGFYQSHIIYHLHRHKLLERMISARHVSELAKEFGYDQDLLSAIFEYIYQTTDIFKRSSSGKYSINPRYRAYYHLGFHLDKFIGAYGPPVVQLEKSLRSNTLGRQFVDRKRQAEAYRIVEPKPIPIVLKTIQDRKMNSMLDLGCGTAVILRELCALDSDFQGYGVDSSKAMCKVARDSISKLGLSDRIRITHTDARHIGTHLRPQVRDSIMSLHAKGIINELFRFGDKEAVSFLSKLKKLFPGRLLFVVDYYGKLTRVRKPLERHKHTLIHDLAQVVSAQGVPPSDLTGWAKVYYAAGCSVEHAYEGEGEGVQWFVHLVRL